MRAFYIIHCFDCKYCSQQITLMSTDSTEQAGSCKCSKMNISTTYDHEPCNHFRIRYTNEEEYR